MLSSLAFSAFLSFLSSVSATLPLTCLLTSESQPNPLSSKFPFEPTGTKNKTLALLPIPFSLAETILSPYSIITHAYLPFLPADWDTSMYPALMHAAVDHDVGAIGLPIVADFSTASIEYPFVDLLSDNSTSFRFSPSAALSTNLIAGLGVLGYGIDVFVTSFSPPCDAYAFASSKDRSRTVFSAKGALDSSFVTATTSSPSPISIDYWKNVTNQPFFSNPKRGCDKQVHYFNTSVTLPPYQPTDVIGNVTVQKTIFEGADGGGYQWTNVWGVRMDTAFVEYNYLDCASLKGYSG
ncbi:hypothetical protein BT69DRAFT_1337254 [Atractiella rhizophila]|nr:hypothetical protein BT69DRAFT_1337254 [Atractiella rhizophila]